MAWQTKKDDITGRTLGIDGLVVVCDDSGGEPITCFTDEAATQLFLAWLKAERAKEEKLNSKLDRELDAKRRRDDFGLIINPDITDVTE
jgi:hypothetical protein